MWTLWLGTLDWDVIVNSNGCHFTRNSNLNSIVTFCMHTHHQVVHLTRWIHGCECARTHTHTLVSHERAIVRLDWKINDLKLAFAIFLFFSILYSLRVLLVSHNITQSLMWNLICVPSTEVAAEQKKCTQHFSRSTSTQGELFCTKPSTRVRRLARRTLFYTLHALATATTATTMCHVSVRHTYILYCNCVMWWCISHKGETW